MNACRYAQGVLEAGVSPRSQQMVSVTFESVEIEGYGPFQGEVSYQLTERGVRVVTGRNEDDGSSDSNGAGKTALVMAPLWALTGRTVSRALVGVTAYSYACGTIYAIVALSSLHGVWRCARFL